MTANESQLQLCNFQFDYLLKFEMGCFQYVASLSVAYDWSANGQSASRSNDVGPAYVYLQIAAILSLLSAFTTIPSFMCKCKCDHLRQEIV